MDAGQIDQLRSWGTQLAEDGAQPDLQPAGRAILLLIDEIERLQATGESDGPSEPPPAREGGAPDPDPPRPPSRPRPAWLDRFRKLAVAAVVLGALVFATFALGARLAAPGLDPRGPKANAAMGPATLPSLRFSVGADPSVLDRVHWKIDGVDVTGRAYLTAGRFVLDGNHLPDGTHRIQATARGGFPGSRTTRTWKVRVDTVGPTIAFHPPGAVISSGRPIVLIGALEPGASLTVDGRPILVSSGRFRLSWPTRPVGAVTLVATDTLRNATTRRIRISMTPRTPPHPVRAVHVTFDA